MARRTLVQQEAAAAIAAQLRDRGIVVLTVKDLGLTFVTNCWPGRGSIQSTFQRVVAERRYGRKAVGEWVHWKLDRHDEPVFVAKGEVKLSG